MTHVLTSSGLMKSFVKGALRINPTHMIQLLESGLDKQDIEASARLLICIISLHQGVTNSLDFHHRFILEKSKKGYFALYELTPEGKARYSIWAEGLWDNLQDIKEQAGILVMNNEGIYQHEELNSDFENIIGVGAHEVRHHVQYCIGIPLFSPSHIDRVRDYRIRQFLSFTRQLKQQQRMSFISQGRPKEYISRQMSDWEFDALMIEELVKSATYMGTTYQDLLDLIQMQPPF